MIKNIITNIFNNFGFTIKKKYNLNRKDIAYLHIGKTGGTQIMNIFSKLKNNNFNVVKHNHEVKLSDISIHKNYFYSIRKPVNRYLSGFYSRLRKGKPRLYVEWSKDEEIAFKNFSNANELAESIYLQNEKGKKAKIAMNSISHINTNQIDWFQKLSFLNDRPPLFIIRQENLVFDMEMFFKILEINSNVKELIDNRPEISHSNDYSKTTPLSNLAIENLNIWYTKDNLFYNICEDWITLKVKSINKNK